MILGKAAAELEAERQKRAHLREKTLRAKEERDAMLREAKRRKDSAFQEDRQRELNEVRKLRAALQAEKDEKLAKRAREREQA